MYQKKEEERKIYTYENKPVTITVPSDSFAFKVLGNTIVVCHNYERKNTFGKNGAKIATYALKYADGKTFESNSATLDTSLANDVRDGLVERMDVILR